MSDELLAGNPELPRLDRSNEGEVHYLKAKAVFYLDDLEGALFLTRRAMKTAGEVPIYRAFDGQILFELARFEEARRSLETAVALDPESGHALYHLALVLERLGMESEAAAAFQKANALDPEHYPLPTRVDDVFFRRAVAEAIDNLPRSIREYVEDVPVIVEDFPSPQLLANENVSPQILGIYFGTPRTAAEVSAQPTDVTRVMLFKRNLEKICRDQDDLIEQIQITVRHEIGHHLGLSEEDMERLGLA
jgi:predicted Zn-dependent protease with MMP-like domain